MVLIDDRYVYSFNTAIWMRGRIGNCSCIDVFNDVAVVSIAGKRDETSLRKHYGQYFIAVIHPSLLCFSCSCAKLYSINEYTWSQSKTNNRNKLVLLAKSEKVEIKTLGQYYWLNLLQLRFIHIKYRKYNQNILNPGGFVVILANETDSRTHALMSNTDL